MASENGGWNLKTYVYSWLDFAWFNIKSRCSPLFLEDDQEARAAQEARDRADKLKEFEDMLSSDIQKSELREGWQQHLNEGFVSYLQSFRKDMHLDPRLFDEKQMDSKKSDDVYECPITYEPLKIPVKLAGNLNQTFCYLGIRGYFDYKWEEHQENKPILHPLNQDVHISPQDMLTPQQAVNLKQLESMPSYQKLLERAHQTTAEKQKIYAIFIPKMQALAKEGNWNAIYDMTQTNYALSDDRNDICEIKGNSHQITIKGHTSSLLFRPHHCFFSCILDVRSKSERLIDELGDAIHQNLINDNAGENVSSGIQLAANR